MHILFISHYYPPEELSMAFLIKEFAEVMTLKGHTVDVLTGYPNWPNGKCFFGYNNKTLTNEIINNVSVNRIPFYASPNGNFLQRVIDFKSFEFSIKKFGKKLKRPDLIYVHIPPNEDALGALWLAQHFRCKYVLNVQDIQPDSAIELGYIKNPVLIKFLLFQESQIYKNADHITVIGDYFKQRIISKGILSDKITVIPNWIDKNAIIPMNRINKLREEWGIPAKYFVVLYAGTFGRIHNTRSLLEAATRLNNKDIFFLLVGQGHDFDRNKKIVQESNLTNVIMKEFVPRSRLSELQALSDISIVTLQKGFGNTSVPSKVLGYMSAARGVLALVDDHCDTARLIRAADCGKVLDPENLELFVQTLKILSNDPVQVNEWGMNARKYVEEKLDAPVVLEKAVNLLESILL